MTSRARRLTAAAASTVLLGLGAAACSGGGESSSDSGSDSGGAAAAEDVEAAGSLEAPGLRSNAQSFSSADTADNAGSADALPAAQQQVEPTDGRSLIRTGNVALRSQDVEDTLFEIGQVLQRTGGEVAEDDTQADDEGEPETSLLTLRVPVAQFEAAMEQLATIGREGEGVDLVSSTQRSEDVSTKVIDVDVRVRLQERSIERISVLLDRAASIRDIVGIERELANREAELGSLQQRQAFLADQTSLSTITVSVERPDAEVAQQEEEDENSFVAGLRNGWDAFTTVTTGMLTATGALLPFAVVLLAVGVPVRLWLRRRQPRPAAPISTQATT